MSDPIPGKLAIDGGAPVRTKPWPNWPVFDELEEQAVLDVVRSGEWWSMGGARVKRFEEEYAAYQDARFCTAVTCGTHALEVTLRALGIGAGDEVIVPPYTFVATVTSVLSVGAVPVFVDIDPNSYNLDPSRIEEAITPRTRAIIPVHIAGGPADLDGALEVARKHGLPVIEDAAQAHGAEWKGRKVGAIGDAGTFSFQASKNLNAGEGGAIVTDNAELYERIWSAHNVGRARTGTSTYGYEVLGGNYRMTEWQGAILLAQLSRLPAQTELRSANAAYLTGLLDAIPGIVTLKRDPRVTRHAYHLYMFRYDAAGFGGKTREAFLHALQEEGVPCSPGYSPLYREAVFQGQAGVDAERRGGWPTKVRGHDCPVVETICRDTVWLFQTQLIAGKQDMDDIGEAIEKIRRAWA